MIVLADADLERAANAATYYSMQNGGQTCISVERVYVEAPVYDDFVDAVTEQGARRCARARRPGPAASRSARSRSRRSSTSSAATSSRRARPGARMHDRRPRAARAPGASSSRPCSPTSTTRWTAMTEETFGPTLPIMKVADAEEAIRLANDSPYGLGASVWTKDLAPRRGRSPAGSRRATSCVNDAQRQLLRARAADGRLEGLRARRPPRRRPASASTRASRRSSSRASRPSATCTCSRTRRGTTKLLGRLTKLLYGRGKRD